jgi:hypothetical protein
MRIRFGYDVSMIFKYLERKIKYIVVKITFFILKIFFWFTY